MRITRVFFIAFSLVAFPGHGVGSAPGEAHGANCSYRVFLAAIQKSKRAVSLSPYALYFYEKTSPNKDFPIHEFMLSDGKIFIDTRGGDLYDSEVYFDRRRRGFRLTRVIFATHLDQDVYLFPIYDADCTSVVGISAEMSRDSAGNPMEPKYQLYRKTKKCRSEIQGGGYDWVAC